MTAPASFTTRRSTMASSVQRKNVEGETTATGTTKESENKRASDEADALGSVDLGAESDVDELIDSDSEKAVSKSTSSTAKSTRGRGRGNATSVVANASAKKGSLTSTTTKANVPSSVDGRRSVNSVIEDKTAAATIGKTRNGSTNSNSKPSPANGHRDESPIHTPTQDVQSALKRESPPSRELLGRTATGGPVPYYYAQPSAPSGRSTQSPMQASMNGVKKAGTSFHKTMGGSSSSAVNSNHNGKGEVGVGEEDLTMQEVDKFLDLIEKYDLDTSNEDVMARSVNELYQEWLEWCAKRSVNSTKSKQSLVSEFPRIHQGAYGSEHQQRAIGIVQRHQSERLRANAEMAESRKVANGHDSSRNVSGGSVTGGGGAAAIFGPRDDFSRGRQRVKDAVPSSSTLIGSPTVVPRALTPGGRTVLQEDAYAASIPPYVLETIHRQVRDEVWKELSVTMNQLIRDQTSGLMAENMTMAKRIEQLEAHSDNLARWIQHLNRGQEDLMNSVFGGGGGGGQGAPPLPSQHSRAELDEMHGAAPVRVSAAHGLEHPQHPGYSLASNRGGYASHAYGSRPNSPPRHAYGHAVRRSLSPQPHYGGPVHHLGASQAHEVYERQGGQPLLPPHAAHPHARPGYRESPRLAAGHALPPQAAHPYHENAVGSAVPYGPVEARPHPRSYHSTAPGAHPGPHDDRTIRPPGSPSAVDGRQSKRPRNGIF